MTWHPRDVIAVLAAVALLTVFVVLTILSGLRQEFNGIGATLAGFAGLLVLGIGRYLLSVRENHK